MHVFTYSEARQKLAMLLDLARREEVRIRRRDGSVFVLRQAPPETGSPLDVPGIRTRATTRDVLRAVRETRARR